MVERIGATRRPSPALILALCWLAFPLCAAAEAEEPAASAETEEPAAATEAAATEADEPVEPHGSARWSDFELEGNHFFAGLVLGPGASGWWPYGGWAGIEGAFFFGLRAGVMFGHTELSVELAPVTWVADFDADPMLSLLVSIGGVVRLGDSDVFWPLRFGLGLTAVNTLNDEVFMQGRLDLLGLVYQWGHLLFEIDLPSIRFHSDLHSWGIWGWMFNLGVTYVI